MKKNYIYIYFLFLFVLSVSAQISLGSSILNQEPEISQIQTYSRYDSPTDNFQEDNFFICIGENNRTIYLRIVSRDNNSYSEISNGGNVSFKTVSIINNSEVTLPSFGDSFKEPMFESISGVTQLSYLDNVTLLNTSLYRVIANVTDTHNATGQKTSEFNVNNTDCIRVEQNVNLITNQTYTLEVNFTEILIVVNDNVSGKIIVTEYTYSPVDNTPADALEKFVTVDITGPIKNVTVNLTIVVSYTDDDITDNQLDESTLHLYNWNISEWEVTDSVVNTDENTVSFIVQGTKEGIADTRLGTYCIIGGQPVSNTPNPSESAAAGGGGGGAGSAFFPPTETPTSSNNKERGGEGYAHEGNTQKDSQANKDEGVRGGSAPKRGNESSSYIKEEKTTPFYSLITHSMYCLIIIIILLFLWLITLLLLILEKRKRKNNIFYEIESEKQDLVARRNELNEKIRMLKEKEDQEANKVKQRLDNLINKNKEE